MFPFTTALLFRLLFHAINIIKLLQVNIDAYGR